jgi:hypothetical protein
MKVCDIDSSNHKNLENLNLVEIDVDWSHEEYIDDTASLIFEYGIDSTWFCTHESAALRNIEKSKNVEIGIHPNFVPLLKGDDSLGKNVDEVLKNLLSIFPDSKVSKSHSLVDSSIIMQSLADQGITHECSMLIDAEQMQPLKPWKIWNGITKVPLFWEDDYACVSYNSIEFSQLLSSHNGLRMYGFHPLHIFLNTESLERYERTRPHHGNPNELIKHRYKGEGTRTRFIKLLEYMSN